MWLALVTLGVAAVLIYWEFWICEGAHLGRGLVVWLYDLTARRYDGIKSFDWDWERHFVGEPLAAVTAVFDEPRILDVGAGTGRVARSLLPLEKFDGTLVCLEPSAKMLEQALHHAPASRAGWLRGWANRLPFPADTFDVVTSLEMLEFTADPRATLREMVRVLRPGGWLLVTNRIGRDSRWILGRTFSRKVFPSVLESAGLDGIEVFPWQVEYDLAWAQKNRTAP